ncbi:MAG: APC family permease [Euryarchaeota archaeon]|nr:APC family permease [Euryarchaeota archaeon]
MPNNDNGKEYSRFRKVRDKVLGNPRDIRDPTIFHKISLIALLSWIGLGADGLSSSSYGPEEAYRVLIKDGNFAYLAIFLALATAITVFIISFTYSKLIEQFPHGGGGYMVASRSLGKTAGLVSGSALLVDYVLTIAVSIAASGEAIFSFLPNELHIYKYSFELLMILFLILINIRGIKESVIALIPIFLLFLVTHALLLGYGLLSQAPHITTQINTVNTSFQHDLSTVGMLGILAIFLRAFSLGAGTYTGIEAVSNGLPVMREPKVKTAKKTMMYMAISLAVVAGVLYICYFFIDVKPVVGQTLNATLANKLFSGWPYGDVIAFVIIFSEGALLLVAAQTGFIGGPRVMANMAIDSWFPKKFAALSERLTMRNGVLVMGIAAAILISVAELSANMLSTDGNIVRPIAILVIMYSINVFLTFSLAQLGMAKLSINNRKKKKGWMRNLFIFIIGFLVCFFILIVTIYEKFEAGGWLTLFITSFVVFICYFIHKHYAKVQKAMKKFDEVLLLSNIHLADQPNREPVNPKNQTAVMLVNGYNGFGVNTFLSITRNFPKLYKNIIFVSVAEIDSGTFKGVEELESLEHSVRAALEKYTELARKLGFAADYRMDIGTDVVETASNLCESIAEEFPKVTFFTGKLVFRHDTLFHKVLHNETALAIQRRLQWNGFMTVILPVRVDH